MFNSKFILLSFFLSTSLPLLVSSKTSFSLNLIHIDSPKSPFHNPALTIHERLNSSFFRSIARGRHLASTNVNFQSRVTHITGEYLMSINIGTPSLNTMMIVDTGSQLIWTQCKPCLSCYRQNAPMYDSSRSSTYRTIPSKSKICSNLGKLKRGNTSVCSYVYRYGDARTSTTAGALSTETLIFDSSDHVKNKKRVSLQNIRFGCSNYSRGNFKPGWAGIVGLSRGPLSLISQLGSSVGYKFSYCLVPRAKEVAGQGGSSMNFGDKANVGPNALVTPIFVNKRGFFPFRKTSDFYYWLKLESISVGNEKVAVANKKKYKKGVGNIIIDSGSNFSILDGDMLEPLVEKLSKVVKYPRTRISDVLYRLCFDVSGRGSSTGRNLQFPDIIFQFTGAAVTLKPLNTFIEVEKNVMCFAFVSPDIVGEAQIWGNLAQQNMHIGFDIKNNKLSIASADCSKI